jgi:hypothetical protein
VAGVAPQLRHTIYMSASAKKRHGVPANRATYDPPRAGPVHPAREVSRIRDRRLNPQRATLQRGQAGSDMDRKQSGLGIDRQGIVLLLLVAIIGLALAGAILWMELR